MKSKIKTCYGAEKLRNLKEAVTGSRDSEKNTTYY